jgi:hypothetical protein
MAHFGRGKTGAGSCHRRVIALSQNCDWGRGKGVQAPECLER